MSFPELLEAVKQLPRPEKVQLMNMLTDELGNETRPTASPPDSVRQLLATPGVWSTGSQVTTDAEGMAAFQAALDEAKEQR